MFYNRLTREFPFETTRRERTYVRPAFGSTIFPTTYGYNPELRHELRTLENRALEQRLMERSLERGWSSNWSNVHTVTAPADVLELDDQFMIEVALPGVVLDDVQLKIDGNTLTICAKRTPTLFEEKAIVLQKELPMTYMVRQFEFETHILHEQIEARLDRGILYVSVPKIEAALRIPVSAGNIESHVPNTVKTRVSSKHESSVK